MKLNEYIEERGIPKSRLAQRCGITYSQLNHTLRGHPTLTIALKIERYTKGEVTPRDLLDECIRKEIYG